MKRHLERFNAFLLCIMFLTTLFQVVARVILGVSSVWSEELARFLYVWLVFLGAALLIRDDEHIRVGVLTDRMGKRAGSMLRILTILLTLPFVGVLTWGAWTNTWLNWGTYAPTLDWLRIGYIYLMIWLSGLLMLWYLTANFLRQARVAITRLSTSSGGHP
ncbi:MAG TPA: TRAP transporter small permease [Candidatus Methylomirabilis sp.]|nr:TRAP transporter small permease [Candidatus Methylomirabilis sp.]HSC71166.1 TRAP transporter small permease [Candidatus Methylomirabilis sp.]